MHNMAPLTSTLGTSKMTLFLRIGAAILTLAILAGVIQLGILSGTNPEYVVWFGIGPIGSR